MQDALVAAADDIVGEGMRETGIPLTATLRHYLAITLARYMREHPGLDRLTLRVVAAMDDHASPDVLRRLGDECLLATSLFQARLRRAGGSLTHYIGLGQTAYDAAAMTEQAWSFAHMRDVVASATGANSGANAPDLKSRIEAARAGSPVAREGLAEEGILAFPAKHWIH